MLRASISAILTAAIALAAAPVKITLSPQNPLMFGKGSLQRMSVIAHYADGATADVTTDARFDSNQIAVAAVAGDGAVTAHSDGAAVIRASYAGRQATTIALVQRASAPAPPSFAADILPILTKLGCNGGSCHGALKGQNGFKLSLFGYEPAEDWEMIVNKHDGRRLDKPAPEKSLLLAKPTFAVKHGGGKVLRADSPEYGTLLAWIKAGTPRHAGERRIASLRIWPENNLIFGKDSKRRLLVTARYTDGTEGDVTHLVKFTSNDDSIASVSPSGTLTALRGGETAIVARAPGVVAATKIGVVLENRTVPKLEVYNFIDKHVGAKLEALRIPPSAPATEEEFLRRASLDIIGVIPTADEAREFLADKSANKRAKLVGDLLTRPEYADYWAIYWGDHLSNTRQLLYNKGPYTFSRWLYDAFRKNLPYDQFVRQLMVSSGNMYEAAATSYFPLMRKELDMAAMTSQLFLGVSIECARCHNHPLEKWTRDDFNGMAAVFSQVRYKGAGPRNNERILYLDFEREFQHPDTKATYAPKALGGPYLEAKAPLTDRRELLVDWMTTKNNPYFARAIVNRMWRQFLGRGLVEPVDDFRATNPPTNEPLLAELARDFADHGYDLHHLIRRITASRTYQTSSIPVPGNKDDTMAYSRYYPKRLAAEQLLDSIGLSTGVPEKFKSLYPGTRAMQVPDPEIESYFLEVFDRPSRQLICERKNTPTLNQALHLVSGDSLQQKIGSPAGLLHKALAAGIRPEQIAENLYLGTLGRFPDAGERELAAEAVRKAGDARKGLEDVFWALLSSKEFLYNH
ncbi:MAG: DUF1549 and DUF1553 domain-containing protein [Bryobacteraceae bacterium]